MQTQNQKHYVSCAASHTTTTQKQNICFAIAIINNHRTFHTSCTWNKLLTLVNNFLTHA